MSSRYKYTSMCRVCGQDKARLSDMSKNFTDDGLWCICVDCVRTRPMASHTMVMPAWRAGHFPTREQYRAACMAAASAIKEGPRS